MEQSTPPTGNVPHVTDEKKNFPVLAHWRFLWVSFYVGFSMFEVSLHTQYSYVFEVNLVLIICQYGFDSGQISAFQAMAGFLQVFGYRDRGVPTGWNIKVPCIYALLEERRN